MAKKKEKTEAKNSIESSAMDKLAEMEKITKMMQERYGVDAVMRAIDAKDPTIGLSSGSLGLDYIINARCGGMPVGQVLELWGPKSSGKSTLALAFCACATANKKAVVYLDTENTTKGNYMSQCGVDTRYVEIIREIDGAISANMAEDYIKTGVYDLLVVDSLANLKPLPQPPKAKKGKEATGETDITTEKVASHSAFIAITMPNLTRVCAKHGVTMVVINQERNKIGSYIPNDTQPTGGHAMEHLDSVRLKFNSSFRGENNTIKTPEGELIGQWTSCLCDKNKTAIPMRTARVPIIFGHGINPYLEVSQLAVEMGVVTNAAGYIKRGDKLLCRGADAFAQLLLDDVELYKELRAETAKAMGITYAEGMRFANAYHDADFQPRKVEGEVVLPVVEESDE